MQSLVSFGARYEAHDNVLQGYQSAVETIPEQSRQGIQPTLHSVSINPLEQIGKGFTKLDGSALAKSYLRMIDETNK